MLAARGIGEPLLSRLIAEAEPETIRRHVLDFDVRNEIPRARKKLAGWLVQSILVPYALHERTVERLEQEQRRATGSETRRRKELAKAMEAERAARVEAWVEEQFDAMDDDELEAWHRRVAEQYPSLARGLDNVDVRTHPRLSRLIRGALSELYDGEEG